MSWAVVAPFSASAQARRHRRGPWRDPPANVDAQAMQFPRTDIGAATGQHPQERIALLDRDRRRAARLRISPKKSAQWYAGLAFADVRVKMPIQMFVRFRQTQTRLQVSLIETRRIDGRVRHEHIASLGTVDAPPSVEERIAFWQRLHERLAKLSNRVDPAMQGTILGDIHARIPMVTLDEQQALKRGSFSARRKRSRRSPEFRSRQFLGCAAGGIGIAITNNIRPPLPNSY
jgi:hypothetical protein